MARDEPAARPAPEVGVHVELLVAGSCAQREALSRAGGSWRSIAFPALVALVRHPRAGVLLFDTGYTERFGEQTRCWPEAAYRYLTPVTLGPGDTARIQLAERGIGPDDVGHIVVSHAHADHIAGLRDFPSARIVCGAAELPPGWRGRSRLTLLRHAVLPGLLPDDFDERRYAASTAPRAATGLPGPLDTGADLFGDGSALAVDLPGHTAGQLGLFLPVTQGPPVLLVGDACWHRTAVTDGQLPPRLVQAGMADPARYRSSVAALAAVHRARPDVQIVPSHCADTIALVREQLGSCG